MITYDMEKTNAMFLVRDIVTDFMSYFMKNNLTGMDMGDIAVADDFTTKYMEKKSNRILNYKLAFLGETKDELKRLIALLAKALLAQETSDVYVMENNVIKALAEAVDFKSEIEKNLPSERDDEE